MPEYIVNLHMHTTYSDGKGNHTDIARAGLKAGLDAVIVTDHNVLVDGVEGYHQLEDRRLLLLIGEEVHDQGRNPQKSHLLVFNVNTEMATFAPNPKILIDQVNQRGGLSFIAHPIDPAFPAFGEDDISWMDWHVNGFTGMELWNGLSELKVVAHNRMQGVFYALLPGLIAHGPIPSILARWDEMLKTGQRIVGIGGSDAHALHMSMGPIHKVIFPYEFHFRTVNNHLITTQELSGDIGRDKSIIYQAFARGNSFVGYDLPAPTRGFNFSAQGKNVNAIMGDEITAQESVTFQVRLPLPTECLLLRDGEVVKRWDGPDVCTHITNLPGAYRVEAYLHYRGKRRGWIFSNPIYLRSGS